MCRSGVRTVAVLVALLAAVAMPGSPEPQTEAPPDDQAPPAAELPSGEAYRIGALFALSGPAMSLGQPESDTARMLQDQINAAGGVAGHPIQVIIKDTQSDEVEAFLAARELVETENVLAIVGPTRSGTTLGIINYIEQSQVPLISCAGARVIADPVREWVFQVVPSDRDGVHRVCRYLADHGLIRIAVMAGNGAYGEAGLDEIEAQAPDAGITIVSRERFGPFDRDMTTQLRRIAATDAQAIVFWGLATAPAIIARQIAQLHISLPLVGSWASGTPSFIEQAGNAGNGVTMVGVRILIAEQLPDTDLQKPLLTQFITSFQERYDARPDRFAAHAWDALQIVCQALRTSGPDRAALREVIEQTRGFVGMDGVFKYSPDNHNGLTPDDLVMVRVEKGHWRLVE